MSSTEPARMGLAQRTALICGIAPLVAGTGIFLLWWATRWNWLPGLGVLTIVYGLMGFAAGAIAVTIFAWRYYRASRSAPRRFRSSPIFAACVLVANFPIALGLMLAVGLIDSRYVVVVNNDSTQRLDDVCVVEGGRIHRLGRLDPGNSLDITFWSRGGAVMLRGTRDRQPHELQIEADITEDQGGRAIVTVRRDGTTDVVHDRTRVFGAD